MARVKCRCGETLEVPADAAERVKCPRCGAKIRVRRSPDAAAAGADAGASAGDGFIRFPCPCGRRLKVRAEDRPEAGKCPDCGRVVPVPESAQSAGNGAGEDGSRRGGSTRAAAASSGSRTADMDALDLEQLEQWAQRFQEPAVAVASAPVPSPSPSPSPLPPVPSPSPSPLPSAAVKMEAGLRVCPRCGKPLHMSATVCRSCGEPVPKR
ncbi:hypothetical protein [Aquisphaera insulae]|uniref:hypothetical protein n=1 Tax=Aquisphaera insulae TaxID=2712864 RepID=UPI0013ED215C|nr:hypothetical protein [Aquisphaera insulae]